MKQTKAENTTVLWQNANTNKKVRMQIHKRQNANTVPEMKH